MQLGAPTHPRRDLLSEIQWIAEQRFGFVDLFLEPDRGALEAIDPTAIRDRLNAVGLDVVGHLAWYLPIGSAMVELRQTAVTTAQTYLETFAQIGTPAVTIHANWPTTMFSGSEGVAWQVESLATILTRAKDLDLRLMYEPVGDPRDTGEHLQTILDALPDLLCHLDIGHCNLHGLDPGAMIRRFPERLHHLHLHDNDGLTDLHLPIGAGRIDWPDVYAAIREVGFNRTVTLEVFSLDRSLLLMSRDAVAREFADLV